MTFRLCVRNGRIVLYASTIPNPSSAQFGWRETVRATAHSIRCSTLFYNLTLEDNQSQGGNTEVSGNDFGRRKRRQVSSDSATVTVYVTLEGQEEMNEFNFNSSVGNVVLGNFYNMIQ